MADFWVVSEGDGDAGLVRISGGETYEVARFALTGFYAASSGGSVYLTSGLDGGSVVAVNVSEAAMPDVSQVGGVGAWPCHIGFSAGGEELATANYEDGTVSRIRLEAGVPTEVVSRVAMPATGVGVGQEAARQDASKPHAATYDADGSVLVPDLGEDVIWRLTGDAVEVAYRMPVGSGPRHLARSDRGEWWVSLELASQAGRITDNGLELFPGTLRDVVDRNYPGDIVAAGRWIVMANRGAHTLAVYDSASGELREVDCGGVWPASLVVSSDVLACANRDSGDVALFSITDSGLVLDSVIPCPKPIAVAAG